MRCLGFAKISEFFTKISEDIGEEKCLRFAKISEFFTKISEEMGRESLCV